MRIDEERRCASVVPGSCGTRPFLVELRGNRSWIGMNMFENFKNFCLAVERTLFLWYLPEIGEVDPIVRITWYR